jgi:hypothetical protein|tara:strand:+ start:10 stop:213 length:204 start_codon:yes stop_codon:yes gene_type:complete
MAVIQKFILVLIMLQPDGEFKIKSQLITECPPAETITMLMNAREAQGEFISWDGSCFPLVFKKPGSV